MEISTLPIYQISLEGSDNGENLHCGHQNNLGKPVLVQGFVENLRDSKYMAFIVLKDITGKSR